MAETAHFLRERDDMVPPAGFKKEVGPPSGKQADAVNFAEKHVAELKHQPAADKTRQKTGRGVSLRTPRSSGEMGPPAS